MRRYVKANHSSRQTNTGYIFHNEANYSTGDYYHYTYDAVGNRLTQETLIGSVPLTTNYGYDAANRLTSVDSVSYTWDNNGNLLNDGVNTYAYDSANRLIAFNGTSSYAYNGLGDRLSQTVNGNTTNYTLDLNAGLTQVLSDGTNRYLYGVGRIAQVNTSTLITDYFLTDALGSVRQLTDSQGEITLANAYEPYGVLAQTAGSEQTSYGFTGEFTDPSGMVYLRARYYLPNDGRFLTRDMWMGDYNSPLSLNRWMYVTGNPINYMDPTGLCGESGEPPCPDWWTNKSQLYVEGYGYFDSGHLGRGWDDARWFVEQINAVLERGSSQGDMLPLPRAKSGRYYWVDYAVSSKITKNDQNQIYGVAYGMYIDFERGYEEHQNTLTFGRLSGFAPADLPSDHFGFWAYINGYKRNEIPTLLQCLGEVKVLEMQFLAGVVTNTAVNHRGDGLIIGIPENREFLPMIRETIDYGTVIINRTKNISWPSWLEIQPIPSGPSTWQVKNRSPR